MGSSAIKSCGMRHSTIAYCLLPAPALSLDILNIELHRALAPEHIEFD